MKTKLQKVIKLLSVNADAKTSKGTGKGYLTGICYLAPANVAGLGNICVHASPACEAVCLFTAGRAGVFKEINKARIKRTRFFFKDRSAFQAQLEKEISALVRKADRDGLTPVIRLNGTSDLTVETLFRSTFERFNAVQFYDYTKSPRRASDWAKGKMPANYHLTFSYSETNGQTASDLLRAGVNVAMVCKGWTPGKGVQLKGETFEAFDADASDLRFLDGPASDRRGRIAVLKAKGKARKDKSGFVVNV